MRRFLRNRLRFIAAGIGLSTLFSACLLGYFQDDLGIPSCPKQFGDIDLKDYPKLKKPARYIILMIGDGFGPAQIEAGFNQQNPPPFNQFPNKGMVTHCSLSGITDSAAAATTMATGVKTLNKVIGQDASGKNLKTILEMAQEKGMATGLVTNTEITHATPAAFAAHQKSRLQAREIALDYLNESQPDILLGGGWNIFNQIGLKPRTIDQPYVFKNYWVVASQKSLKIARESSISYNPPRKILGLFAEKHLPYEYDRLRQEIKGPSLLDLTQEAFAYLEKRSENNPRGFFIMVEGGRIDHAGHGNDFDRLVSEVKAFAQTVDWVLKWAQVHSDTLVLVTADHETGGLKRKGQEWAFTTDEHTTTPVYLWGYGVNSEKIQKTQDNRAVFHILNRALES